MLKNAFQNIIRGKTFAGLELTSTDNVTRFTLVIVKMTGQSLELVKEVTCDDLKTVISLLPNSVPIFLVINTEQVLLRMLPTSGGNLMDAIHKAFPNLSLDEFYFEAAPQASKTILAVCRILEVNKILEQLSDLNIAAFHLGLTTITDILPHLERSELSLNSWRIQLLEGQIDTLIKNQEPSEITLNVNGLSLKETSMVAFSAILTAITNSSPKSNFDALNSGMWKEHQERRFFRVFSRAGLIFLLCLLLGNFLIFNSLYEKVNTLEQTSGLNTTNRAKVLKLDSIVAKKEKFVNDILTSSSSKSSLYMNQITNALPETILLTEINYHPLLKQIKENELIHLDKNTILIRGIVQKNEDFSLWIESLEKLTWLKEVQVTDYGMNPGTTANFGVKIIVKNEAQN